MKKITLLSLVAASVLFTACGEDAKKAITDATASVTETVKEGASSAVSSVKEGASNAVESAKDKVSEAASDAAKAAEDKIVKAAAYARESAVAAEEAAAAKAAELKAKVSEKASSVVESAKSAIAPVAEKVEAATAPAATADNAAGKAIFAKCAACHGQDGKLKALGKSNVIAGQPAADLEASIHGYQAGTRNVSGMGVMMKSQVANLSDEDIKAVTAYISGL